MDATGVKYKRQSRFFKACSRHEMSPCALSTAVCNVVHGRVQRCPWPCATSSSAEDNKRGGVSSCLPLFSAYQSVNAWLRAAATVPHCSACSGVLRTATA